MRTSIFVTLLTLATLAHAADSPAPTDKPEDRWFKGMKYRLIGPFRGGRSLTVTGIPADPNIYYFGGVGGGLWKSTDGATTWSPIFDKEGTSAIGSIAVAPSDPNILYVGTGEACLRGNISHGDGVYKSLDAGKTWKNVGLRDTRAIGAVIVHPRNPDIAFVAALGHPYGPNTERGVFRTTDGGKTWEKVLYKDENTGAVDVVFDPNNPNILFAALWQVHRTPYSLDSGGPGSGLYRSADGGTTWKAIDGEGFPKPPYGKIGVAVSADSDRIYALIEAAEGGLYRSDDGGDKWQLVNPSRSLIQRAWYYMHVTADPKDANTLYIQDVQSFKSTDGGHSFNKVKVPHGDNHALWIDPTNTRRMILGNDGGASVSLDGGKSWSTENNQPTAQFYHVITDNSVPYRVYGAQQDNSTVAILSRSDSGAIDRPDWYPVGGGEAGYIAPDPRDPNIVYAGDYEGTLTRFDKRTGQIQSIAPWPEISDGEGAAKLEHRFQWTSPTVISPHDPNVLYHGGERLFKTSDGGMHWEAISPDLTRNDKSKQAASGGSIDIDDTGTEYYDTIFTIAESPLSKGLIWVGTDDGLIQVTGDGGKKWLNVTPKDMPEWSKISLIEASPHDGRKAFAAVDRHQLDDYRPYIYKTTTFGNTWTKITNGIPDNTFVRVVREDPKRPGLLYAGTETGIYVSFNDGELWRPLKLNLPTTPVHDLAVKDDDLVVATHGRAFWILDDLTPLRQFDESIASESVHLYNPQTTYRFQSGDRPAKPIGVGENPPPGAIIDFYLKDKPEGELTIEILDSSGKRVRLYSSATTPPIEEPLDPDDEKPKKEIEPEAGLNRFTWDLRYDSVPRVPGYFLYEYEQGSHGPVALPGTYKVKLSYKGKSYEAAIVLKPDPRVKTTPEDLEKQFSLLMRIDHDLTHVYETVNQMQDVRRQLKDLRERHPNLANEADALDKKIAAAEEKFIDLRITSNEDSLAYPLGIDGKLAALAMMVGSADTAPTQPENEVFEKYSRMLDSDLTQWSTILTKDLPAFDKLTDSQNLHAIMR